MVYLATLPVSQSVMLPSGRVPGEKDVQGSGNGICKNIILTFAGTETEENQENSP
jgi:hypothetical protein